MLKSTSVEATSYKLNATRNVWECRDISEYVPNYENFQRQYQFREKFEKMMTAIESRDFEGLQDWVKSSLGLLYI